MDRINRRTFFSNGLKAGAALSVVGAGIADPLSGAAAGAGPDPSGGTAALVASGVPGPPTHLTTVGAVTPVGVDPDAVTFAWRLNDPRRAARQGAYRIVVTDAGRTPDTIWDSGEVASGAQAFVDYGGPTLEADTRYGWTVRTSQTDGHWSDPSRPAVFTTGLRPNDWMAQWLRPGPAESGLEEYAYLRTRRALPPGTISSATAYIAAAHKYQLWVNGNELDTGPSFCFPDQQYYQATDVTAALVAGRVNAVGVLHHWYGPGRGRPPSTSGLLVQLAIHYTDGTVVTVASDGSWRTRPAEWLPAPQRNTDAGDFVEWIDARLHPTGWADGDFDDASWDAAAVLGPVGTEPFTALFTQRTRIQQVTVPAASVHTLSTGSVVVDFGKVYAGRPVVSFRQGTAGHTVPMHVGYTLDPDGSVSTVHNTQATDLSFSYIQRQGPQSFVPYWYLGYRYLQIDDPGEALTAAQVTTLARHAAMPDTPAATFSSSDRGVDAVWDLCAHSALYTSQEQFIDTPTREKGQFLWDAGNESQTVMRVYGEQNLSWQAIRDMDRAQARYWPSGQVNEIYPNDDGPQNYPTFSAHYPEWIWRYYLSTGDQTTVRALLPSLMLLSDYFEGIIDPSTGLVSGQSISTNGENEFGYDYDTNADTTLNILTANAFRRIGAVAIVAGDQASASDQQQRAESLTTAVNGHLIDAGGLYVDGLRADGSQSTHRSQQANALALAYGIVPAANLAAVAGHVASLNISVQPDHALELVRALHAGGRDTDLVRILTDSSYPGWAAILRAGGTFMWETWTPSDLIGDSMSHGWGSSTLVGIQEALLGVVPTAPGPGDPSTLVSWSPPGGGVSAASGMFPTPAGPFSVGWRSSASGMGLSVTVPPNAGARCQLPAASPSEVTEQGVPVERAVGVRIVDDVPGGLVVAVGAGRYDFAVRSHRS